MLFVCTIKHMADKFIGSFTLEYHLGIRVHSPLLACQSVSSIHFHLMSFFTAVWKKLVKG